MAELAGPEVPGHLFGCYFASMPGKVRWRLASAGLVGEVPTVRKDILASQQAATHAATFDVDGEDSEDCVADNVMSTACVLEFKFRTLPWHRLTPEQACQFSFWVHVTGHTNLQMFFVHARQASFLRGEFAVDQFGMKNVAKSFAFELEAGQSAHLMADLGDKMPPWFSEVSQAIRRPASFVTLIEKQTWKWAGLPIFPKKPHWFHRKELQRWLTAESTLPWII